MMLVTKWYLWEQSQFWLELVVVYTNNSLRPDMGLWAPSMVLQYHAKYFHQGRASNEKICNCIDFTLLVTFTWFTMRLIWALVTWLPILTPERKGSNSQTSQNRFTIVKLQPPTKAIIAILFPINERSSLFPPQASSLNQTARPFWAIRRRRKTGSLCWRSGFDATISTPKGPIAFEGV